MKEGRAKRKKFLTWLRSPTIAGSSMESLVSTLTSKRTDYYVYSDVPTASATMITGISRKEAERALRNQPEGTFILRPATDGNHAISMVSRDDVVHMKIYHVNGGSSYSFTKDGIPSFPTIAALVQYHSIHSLSSYNNSLRTRLVQQMHVPGHAASPGIG